MNENKLAERLERLGETTTFDPDALAKIIERGDVPPVLTGRRVLVAAAAGTLIVGGVAAVATYERDQVRIGTQGGVDDDPPTSIEHRPSSTLPTTTEAPTTTVEPRADTTATTEFTGDGAPPNPADFPQEERKPALLTLESADYTVELVLVDEGILYFRRTDGVGNRLEPYPDAYGSVEEWAWGLSGSRCIEAGGRAYEFPDAPTRSFTYGWVGADIARLEVVMDDGTRTVVPRIGDKAVHNGMRPWLVERPNGHIARVEGFDRTGALIAEIPDIDITPVNAHSPATCDWPQP